MVWTSIKRLGFIEGAIASAIVQVEVDQYNNVKALGNTLFGKEQGSVFGFRK